MDFNVLTQKAAENGYLPDWLVRFGIRKLLQKTLDDLSVGGSEKWQCDFQNFIAEAKLGPIALETDKANEQHYELPWEFFDTVLGDRKKYSSCFWDNKTKNLDESEINALKLTCEHAQLEDGMQILELGCGWGSLSLWMAENYPISKILAVSNSSVQREYIESQIEKRGLSNLTVQTADMNNFSTEEKFDRVVSVEMFEHMRNHAELLRRVSTWLKPAGKLFVHIFCHRDFVYPYEAKSEEDWMAMHFFTGGMMPSDDLFAHYQDDMKLGNQWRWNGKHYEKTCNAWLEKCDAAKSQLMPLFKTTYGEKDASLWFQRWRMFFMACAELFGFKDGNEYWVSHYLFENRREA